MEKKKNMIGERIIGYICIEEGNHIDESKKIYVYTNAIDSIGYRLNTEKSIKIYEVEGISISPQEMETEAGDRFYYECKEIKIIKEITHEQLVNGCMYNCVLAVRLIAFYPITEIDALKLAKTYTSNKQILTLLSKKFPSNNEIRELIKEYDKKQEEIEKAEQKYEAYAKKYGIIN